MGDFLAFPAQQLRLEQLYACELYPVDHIPRINDSKRLFIGHPHTVSLDPCSSTPLSYFSQFRRNRGHCHWQYSRRPICCLCNILFHLASQERGPAERVHLGWAI